MPSVLGIWPRLRVHRIGTADLRHFWPRNRHPGHAETLAVVVLRRVLGRFEVGEGSTPAGTRPKRTGSVYDGLAGLSPVSTGKQKTRSNTGTGNATEGSYYRHYP